MEFLATNLNFPQPQISVQFHKYYWGFMFTEGTMLGSVDIKYVQEVKSFRSLLNYSK